MARAAIVSWIDALEAGTLPRELALDVLVAAEMAPEDDLAARAMQLREGDGVDRVADHRWALAGGDFDRGRNIFLDHPVAQCQRCHSFRGNGGVAGPALDGIGARQSRDQILKSLVDPSAILVEGFETDTGISAMPEIHWTLTADEIRDLLEFVCGDAD
jgi:mono/diheme cytochrome c family protein